MSFEIPDLKTLEVLDDSFSNVKFFDKNHEYEIGGDICPMSVSGLISKYEKPFDSEAIATRSAKIQSVSKETILKTWKYSGDYASHKGSEFHLYAENYLERRMAPIDKKALIMFLKENDNLTSTDIENYYREMAILIRNFKNFYEWWKQDHIIIKSEYVIGDRRTKICGTIDNLSYNKKTKSFVIFDYKTNKKIEKKNKYNNFFLPPFEHLDKCEYVKYSLQLWLYRLIFERNNPYTIDNCQIVWVNSENDYELFCPLDLRKEAAEMLESVCV